jgi:AsmA protein
LTKLDLAGSGVNDFAPDIAGLVSLDGTLSSDGELLHINGKLTAEKIKLAKKGTAAARPVQFDFNTQHDLRRHSGALPRGDIRIGSARAQLTGTYTEEGESVHMNMALKGPQMALSELQAMLPALGIALPAGSRLEGGTLTVMLQMEGPADRLITTGSVAMNNTRLTGFDLPQKMAGIEKLAGIKGAPDTEIQVLSSDVRLAPEGASARNMKLVVPAIGEISGAGTVSPANDLDFRMSALVHTSGLLAVVADKPIPFTVQGTCTDPVFRPDMKAVAKEEIKGVEGGLEKAAGGLLKGLLGGKKR